MRIKRIITFIVLIFPGFIIGCGDGGSVKNYYDDLAERADALVKFDRRVIDIYRWDLQASLERAIDVTNADTASRIAFREINYPLFEKERYFIAYVDMLDYRYMINAVKNFISLKSKVEMPMFYRVNDELRMVFRGDSGLTLEDSLGSGYFVPADSVECFWEFLEFMKFSLEADSVFDIKGITAYVDSIIFCQTAALKKRYKLQQLKVKRALFRLGVYDSKTDRRQVDCVFSLHNPNLYMCIFDASIILEGKGGRTIHSFSAEENRIEAAESEEFQVSTVLRSYQAERIKRIYVEIHNVTTEDERARKYMN